MLEKPCGWWLIWYLLLFCHGGAEGQLQWVVKEKVTAYGQNLTLFCPIENCCSEPAGWSVGSKAIILDVKTFSNDPKVKYHGTYNKEGFGVVIRNLSEADLDITYRCVYGFDQSTPKYLFHGDVFKGSQLQWVVKEKVTAYGQNLILFCPVENCCSEPAGWSVGPKSIIVDVKTFSNDPKVKYHGTYNKDGFGVVIRNLSEADLNVPYCCVYGFVQSTPKYLLHGDIFRESQLQWVVKEKVTDYGQNLTLFCPVENCCSEPAGWSVGTKSIIIDVKTFSNHPKMKYNGTYNTDGFGVIIRNLSEGDLNVTYHCIYGFDESTPKYLLHGDVFKENVPDKEKENDTTATIIVVTIVVIMVAIGFIRGIVYFVFRSPTDEEMQRLTDSENEQELKNIQTMEALNEKLCDAAEDGDKDLVQSCLQKGAYVNYKGFDGKTPLHSAAELGRTEVVYLILKSGASPSVMDNQGETPLHWVAVSDNTEIASLLLKSGASTSVVDNQGETPLHWAAASGNTGVVDLLLKSGASPSVVDNQGKTPLHWAAKWSRTEVVDLLLKSGASPSVVGNKGETPLQWAAASGITEVVDLLLKSGASPSVVDNQGKTPLHWAAKWGRTEVVDLLLKSGASPSVVGNQGETPLHWAAASGNTEVVDPLLKSGASPSVVDNQGKTPLQWAAKWDRTEVVDLLLKSGASQSVVGIQGRTPLHHAAWKGKTDVTKVLVEAGASLFAEDNERKTPYDVAHYSVKELLQDLQ